MKIEWASYSDIGARDNNEDRWLVKEFDNSFLALVADGLGGHANGEIASQIAVDSISEELEHKDVDEDTLGYAILNASKKIASAGISGHTTIAALWINDNYAVAAHVGDSRIYQFRDGKIIYQSLDHSVIQMAVLVGEFDADAVRYHKDRNKLFRVLGEENEDPKVDSVELVVKPGDYFLLCSDGFWEPVTEAQMQKMASLFTSPAEWLEKMRATVQKAHHPKQDNNTAICIVAK